jgi:hypothetical protein
VDQLYQLPLLLHLRLLRVLLVQSLCAPGDVVDSAQRVETQDYEIGRVVEDERKGALYRLHQRTHRPEKDSVDTQRHEVDREYSHHDPSVDQQQRTEIIWLILLVLAEQD